MTTMEELIRLLEGDDEFEFIEGAVDFGELPETAREGFNWCSQQQEPVVETFDTYMSGVSPQITLTENSRALDFYEHFVDRELMERIVIFTNRYHQNFVRSTDLRV